jgi:hypothetical protein
MELDINITTDEPKVAKPQYVVSLKIRRTLDGDIIIFDHKDLDIVVMPQKQKVITFPKESYGDHVYKTADRLFRFLSTNGIVKFDSIQGSNVYGAYEAKLQQSDKNNNIQMALMIIDKFIQKEKPYFEVDEFWAAEHEDSLTDPDSEESTEFDASRHSADKGSIRPGLKPFGIANIYRL